MSVRRIDIAALKTRFRAAATARGIDPVEGATSFQVVHHVTARPRVLRDPDWWQDHELWDRVDDPIRHSVIEEAVLDRLWFAAYFCYLERTHTTAQAAHSDDEDIPPLREHLAARGEQLVWVETDDGVTIPQVTLAV